MVLGLTTFGRYRSGMPSVNPAIRHFFVDEAGDTTLFDREGRLLVGTEGVSRTFMVGICELSDPAAADARLAALRDALLKDPYFRGVPSMSPTGRKTALSFHAKDDLPEVRREVFTLISQLQPKVFAAFRRKAEYAESARRRFQLTGEKVGPNLLYDELVERSCTNLLHKADEVRFVFARRGKALRNVALSDALGRARDRFNAKWGTAHQQPVIVTSGVPSDFGGLQVADYLLWALQRLIERGEDRYYASVASHFRLIMDLDDRRKRPYGEWYSRSNPLSLEKLKPVAPG